MMLTSTVSRSSWGTDSPSLMIGHITSNMKFTILLEWFSLKESLKCHKCQRMVSLTYLVQSNTMKMSTKDSWKEFSIQQIVFNCSFRCFLSFPYIFRNLKGHRQKHSGFLLSVYSGVSQLGDQGAMHPGAPGFLEISRVFQHIL